MIGLADVTRIEDDTSALREIDYRSGGGACLDGVLAQIRESAPLLTASALEQVRQRLHVAMADLHNLAGWACFDTGLISNAQNHFCHALVLAGLAGDNGLTANVCYRLGRVLLHHGHLDEALRYFGHGQLAAARSGDELEASILSVNSAWAQAKKGSERDAGALLDRGREQFAAADHQEVAGWARFFTEADLSGLAGAVHTDLADTVNPRHTRTAGPLLSSAIDGYDAGMVRSRTLCLILSSTNHLIAGEVEAGVAAGLLALSSADSVNSTRVRDRLHPVAAQARRHRGHAGALDLAERIDASTAAPPSP